MVFHETDNKSMLKVLTIEKNMILKTYATWLHSQSD